KWQEAGGRGWSNSYAGRMPMPGWMSGTNTVPPDPAGGSRLAYVTYTHGGSKTNDLWLISPTLKGVVATSTVSFWYRSSFSNFADSIYLMISTNPAAYRKSDFTIQAYHQNYPRGWPSFPGVGGKDFPEWTNIVVNIGALVPAGMDIRLGFREYYNNNWYDVRANEMDVIRTDLWAPPVASTIAARVISPSEVAVDYFLFAGYPTGTCGVCWGPDPEPVPQYAATPSRSYNAIFTGQGSGSCAISNIPLNQAYYVRAFVVHSKTNVYGRSLAVQPGDSAGEGFLLESFEDVPIGYMPPAGWRKWEEAGGRGWSNSWAGRMPMPGWMSGTNTVPPDPDAGSRLAYVTYTHGGSKTNDLWLISPTIKNVPSNCPLSFWYRSSFSNFADSIYLMVSTNPAASRKSDFTIQAYRADFPRGYPTFPGVGGKDFPDWTNINVDIGSHVAPGSDIRIAFREYNNNNWYDVRANELDVIKMGTRVRSALAFDGIDDYVVLPITNNTPQYTVEAWVKPLATVNQSILLRTDGSPLINYSQQLRIAGGVFEHFLNDGASKTVTGTTVVQAGRWYHVAGSARNGGPMRLFVNGVEEGTPVTIGTMWTGGNQCQAGAASGGGFGPFYGLIDEARFWTAERAANQILDAMNIYLRGLESGLLACYRFDSTWGTNVFDSSEPPDDAYLSGTAADPQWVEAETPLGDYLAAENWNNRGLWTQRSAAAPTNGLALSTPVSGITNFIVFGHNNLSSSTNADIPSGFVGSRFGRVWHADVRGKTNPVADLVFNPSQAAGSGWYIPGGNYALLRRSGKSGNFSILKNGADAVVDGTVGFTNVLLDKGYYTVSLAAPAAPNVLSATGFTAHVFWANWDASATATNYWLDVASNAAFTIYVPGYQNLVSGDGYSAAVTGLLPGITYYYRLRAEHAGGISTNSAVVSATTLTEGSIGVSSSDVYFATRYGADPSAQWIALTNRGETDYSFTNQLSYSSGAGNWLALNPLTGMVGAAASTPQQLTVSVTGVNAGTYYATNTIISSTATNSPQSWIAVLTVDRADQSVSFPAIPDQAVQNVYGLSATADSGLGAGFAVVSGPAVINNGTNLSFSATGAVLVAASQAGNSNWNAAVTVTNLLAVYDDVPPVFAGCPGLISAAADSGDCSAVVTWAAPAATDNWAVAWVTNNYDSGATFPVGTSTVVYVAMDMAANSSTCLFSVVVSDAEAPVISDCPADIATTNIPGSCLAMVTWTAPTADDNCGVESFTNDYNSGDTFNVGTTVVHYVATDASGNSSVCSFNVVVADAEQPVISDCPADIATTNDPGNCSAVVTWIAPTADDNCGVDSFTNSHSSGDTFNVGTTRVYYVAADAAGNSTTCSFNVVVADVEDPFISDCPADIAIINDPGNCSAAVTWTAPTADDNCAVASFISTADPGDVFSAGTTLVEYVAADAAGHSVTCSFSIVVSDAEAPVISGCPADILATNDPGACSAVVIWTAPTADDNCGVDSFTNSHSSGDTFNVGTTRVYYVAADAAGNASTCSFSVVVSDVDLPVISGCPADILTTNDPGNCSAMVTWTAPAADDNCGVESFTNSHSSGDTFNVGTTVVHYVAADAAGNAATCSFAIVV
ncbi:MAG: HYR domain-containing protein, partial [Kiritimatiellae bacterium]|nr:HYR domain-containing protein [Kiritimatiellia bacterium]